MLTNLRREILCISAQRTLLREGDIPESIYTLYSGWAFRYRQLTDGRRQILSFLIPGDIVTPEVLCFGSFALPFSVKALTTVYLCRFEREQFREMLTSELQEKRVAEMGEHFVTNMYRRLTDVGCRSAAGRLAQLILELEFRLKQRMLTRGNVFDFPMRQEHLADALGLTTVYINRTLSSFRKGGVIELERQKMTIRDMGALRAIAEEE